MWGVLQPRARSRRHHSRVLCGIPKCVSKHEFTQSCMYKVQLQRDEHGPFF